MPKWPQRVRKLVESLLTRKANADIRDVSRLEGFYTSKFGQMPPELFAHVLEFVACHAKKQDLLSMCLVCKGFQDEALRILYRDVNLGEYDLAAQKAWFDRVSAGPEVAVWVHSLTLRVPLWDVPTGKEEEMSKWFDSFADGLRSLVHLKEYVNLLSSLHGWVEAYRR
jgi:hypothetical protein